MLSNKTISKTRLDERKLESESILLLETPEGHPSHPGQPEPKSPPPFSANCEGQPGGDPALRLSRSISCSKNFILSHTRWIVKALLIPENAAAGADPHPCLPGSPFCFMESGCFSASAP
jgi:hypothetical protein